MNRNDENKSGNLPETAQTAHERILRLELTKEQVDSIISTVSSVKSGDLVYASVWIQFTSASITSV